MQHSLTQRKKPIQRVMLVDDDSTDNFLHARVLEKSGLVEQVIVFEHAEDALAYLRSNDRPVDVIFLDINMPRMNGFTFLEKFRELENAGRANALVVMLSTSISPADIRRTKQFSAIVRTEQKPLSQNTLESLVGDCFNFPVDTEMER